LIGCKLDEDIFGNFAGVTWIKMKDLKIQKQKKKIKDEGIQKKNQAITKGKKK
jgi:hypothetical protein